MYVILNYYSKNIIPTSIMNDWKFVDIYKYFDIFLYVFSKNSTQLVHAYMYN